ncbi:DUF397 domain-containing protein [Actinokineospora iranica]|uniref:DUF397 domain-containing protein n=1 Tax=Actinokineospora iranica TaxID=1271860 RepID=A0A1G6P8R3_9PSEU|nr:DUF397 domain-containing protein [Actinokineospora iranica]SDC75797.1 protein of unknown function [Actinokineospora iranica]
MAGGTILGSEKGASMSRSVTWRKSSFSDANGGECVEVRSTLDALRDSKNQGGPALAAPVESLVSWVRGHASR